MMSEAELRAVLGAILKLGDIGRLHPDEQAQPGTGQLVHALGMVAAVATLALEGLSRSAEELELSEEAFVDLMHRRPVIVQTKLGFRLELTR